MLILKKLILNSSLIYLHSLLISFLFVLFINIDIESAFIIPDEVDHIYVCAVYILQHALLWVDSDAHGLVYADSLYAVARLHKVYEVLIHTQMHSVWGLALGYGFRGLLHLDVLFV
jgi:hypothetical protein